MSSIQRAVQVMELLARKSPMGVRAIASQLELPVGSVHRLMEALQEANVAERTASAEWELSFRLLEITGQQLERIHLPALTRSFAENIAEITKENVNTNVPSGLRCVCVDKVRGSEGIQLDMRIGSGGPLHCGGSGKAILAFMSPAAQQKVLEGPLPALTTRTITNPKALQEELGRIRERGYSIDDQEVVMGVYCVAVPIMDAGGRAVGSISITGTSVKKPGPEIQPLVDLLNGACSQISRKLGFRGSYPLTTSAI